MNTPKYAVGDRVVWINKFGAYMGVRTVLENQETEFGNYCLVTSEYMNKWLVEEDALLPLGGIQKMIGDLHSVADSTPQPQGDPS